MDEPDEPGGGDPACWLGRVCPDCGRFREDMALGHCENCGAPFDDENRE